MIAIRKLSILLWAFLFATLAACGSDDDPAPAGGGGGGGGGGTTPQAVELEQLEGTWFGTFDRTQVSEGQLEEPSEGEVVRSFQFEIDSQGAMSNMVFSPGTEDPDNLPFTGAVVRADDISSDQPSRVFRLDVQNNNNQPVVSGMLVIDPQAADYMVYVYENGQLGVLQRVPEGQNAPALPTFAQTDIDNAWEGIAVTAEAANGFSPVSQTSSDANCTATDDTSQCEITTNATSRRTAADLSLDNPSGRWTGTFSSEAPDGGRTRILLSTDKSFAGVWACSDVSAFPQMCDFSAWRQGESQEQANETEQTEGSE